MDWETGGRFPIYPPPEFTSQEAPTPNTPDSEIRPSPRPQKRATAINVPESPSQIPDSQPTNSKKFIPNLLDIAQQPSSPSRKQDDQVPSSVHASTPKPSPIGSQSAACPPRAVSLEPVHLSLPNSPAPTDCSISPDRLPNKSLFFTSTPKSKPLKALLPGSVNPLCIEVDCRKNSKFHIQCQKLIATTLL